MGPDGLSLILCSRRFFCVNELCSAKVHGGMLCSGSDGFRVFLLQLLGGVRKKLSDLQVRPQQ